MSDLELSQAKVLIVDDSPGNLKVLTLILKRNYQIYSANGGRIALTQAFELRPDIILLDIMMPDLSGYDVCTQLKQMEPTQDIPIIFLSALDDPQSKVKAFEVGGVDFITKPFQSQEVIARVQNHLAIRHLQRQLRHVNQDLERRVAARTAELQQTNENLQQQIQQRKRTEESLLKSEETYRTLFRDSKDAIFIISPEGFISEINPAGLELFGYTKETVGNLTLRALCVNPADEARFIEQMSVSGAVQDFEVKLQRNDGTPMTCLITASQRLDAEQEILSYQGIIRDITERQRADRERLLLLSIQRELGIAQEIQESLLPPPEPDWVDVAMLCQTTPAREMGGDLYAYHAFEDDAAAAPSRYAICAGDVSGKGMPAALLMAVTLASFHSVVRSELRPGACLTRLHTVLSDYTQRSRQNCAMVSIEITPPQADTPGQLIAANAGCIAPIIKRQTGEVVWVDVGGMPLGVGLAGEMDYNEVTVPIAQGDVIILTSDGVVEAQNRHAEMFGFDRLTQAVQTIPAAGEVDDILAHLLEQVQTFTDYYELHDDMTIVVVQI